MAEETSTKTKKSPNGKYFNAFVQTPGANRPRSSDGASEAAAKKIAANNLKAAAQSYTGEALETLVEVMRNRGANPQTRVAAANAILERGHGKSVNQTEISVSLYDKWSDADLIKFISGETVIEGEVMQPRDNPPELEYDGDAGDE